MPAIPEVKPCQAKYDDTEREEEAARKRAKLRASRTGRSSTILTGDWWIRR